MSDQISAAELDSFVLFDIAHVEMGQSPDSRYVVEDPFQGLAFLQGNAEFGAVYPEPKFGCLRPAKKCKAADVLISVRAPVGAINIADRDYCIGRGLAAIRGHGIKPSLLGEVVARRSSALRRVAQGTTFEAINKNDLLTLKLSLPPRADWPQIAQILDTLDTAIRETEAIIAKLKAIKQGMLHDLLTRGLDTNGELRPPQSEAPHLYKESLLGWVPKEWEFGPLSHFVPSAEYGISTALGDFGVPVLRMNNIAGGEAELSDIKYSIAAIPDKLWLHPGDVLFNRTNSIEHVGRTGIWRGQIERATFASYLVRLNTNDLILKSELLNIWLNWPAIQVAIRRFATPAVQQVNINPTNLRQTQAAFPVDLYEQSEIITRIAGLNKVVRRSAFEQIKLQALKSGLMDDLLTGRVRVTPLLEGSPP